MANKCRACLSGHVIPAKCWREESDESLLFLEGLQMAVIPSKMCTKNQSRPGGRGVWSVGGGGGGGEGPHFSQGGNPRLALWCFPAKKLL